MTYNLAAHQIAAIEEIRQRNVALWYKPRTGKTICPLAYAVEGIRNGTLNNALVVCPASVKSAWYQNIDKMPLFAGYDEIDRDMLREVFTITSFGKIRSPDGLRKEYKKNWDLVVIDESHALGDRQSQQTKSVLQLSKYAKKRVILTGTPDGKRYEKLYGQLKFLNPELWPRVRDFDDEIITVRDFFKKPIKYNESAAVEYRDEYGIYARLEDCYDMPPILADDIRYVDLAEKKVYKDIRDGNFTPYNIDPQGGGTFGIKLLQVVSGHMKTDEGLLSLKTEKETALADIITGTDEPLVIFCQFRASIDLCARIAAECGRSVITYDGRADDEDYLKFQRGEHNVIVAQYKRGGVGIDLSRADTVIFYEPTGSTIDHEQARARIRAYKAGNTVPASYLYLVTYNTIEHKLFDRMIAGLDTPDKMLDML